MAHLALALLGPLRVTLDGRPVTGFDYDKVRALLTYLAVEADHPHRRDALAALGRRASRLRPRPNNVRYLWTARRSFP